MKEVKAEKKTDNGLAAKVRKLEEKLEGVVKVLERQFGIDIDRDGKVGSVRVGVLALIACVCLAGAVFAANEVIWSLKGSGSTDLVKVDEEGDLTATSVTAATVTSTGVIDGVPEAGFATNTATATATESYGQVNKTVLVLDDTPIVCTSPGADTNSIGGTKIYDFPAGRILVLGVTVDGFQVSVDTNSMDAADGGDYGFGTAVPGVDGVMDGTAVDFCPATSHDPMSGTNSAALAASAQFDGTTTPIDLYVNLLVDHGDITEPSNFTNKVSATVEVYWLNLGDY